MTLTITGLATESDTDHRLRERVPGDRARARRRSSSGRTATTSCSSPLLNVAVSDDVAVYQGCDRSVAVCHARFSNVAHYLGMPLVPQKNPFSGSGLV
jgi:hypothetical protein